MYCLLFSFLPQFKLKISAQCFMYLPCFPQELPNWPTRRSKPSNPDCRRTLMNQRWYSCCFHDVITFLHLTFLPVMFKALNYYWSKNGKVEFFSTSSNVNFFCFCTFPSKITNYFCESWRGGKDNWASGRSPSSSVTWERCRQKLLMLIHTLSLVSV